MHRAEISNRYIAEIWLASEETSERAAVGALCAAWFCSAEQNRVGLMRVAVKEDQLLCVYNLAALDVIFLRTHAANRQAAKRQAAHRQLVSVAGDTDASLCFQFR